MWEWREEVRGEGQRHPQVTSGPPPPASIWTLQTETLGSSSSDDVGEPPAPSMEACGGLCPPQSLIFSEENVTTEE